MEKLPIFYDTSRQSDVVQHVQTVHFKLPRSIKLQKLKGIVDNRNPNDYIQEDAQLAARRLRN